MCGRRVSAILEYMRPAVLERLAAAAVLLVTAAVLYFVFGWGIR